MGLFDLFKPSLSTAAHIDIQFPEDFETSSRVSILLEGSIPNGMEVWIWDLYYAKTLYNLGRCEATEGLKSQLEAWSEERATINMTGLPLLPEDLILDPDLILSNKVISRSETYRIDVLDGERKWPTIQTQLPSGGYQNRAAYSVLALAQYFIERGEQFFAREFPVHVLAMRKYYSEIPYTKLASVIGAPTQAINTALQLFEDINESEGEE